MNMDWFLMVIIAVGSMTLGMALSECWRSFWQSLNNDIDDRIDYKIAEAFRKAKK